MWVQDMKNYETAKKAIDASIEKSGLGYLDLYLLHQAMGDYLVHGEQWKMRIKKEN